MTKNTHILLLLLLLAPLSLLAQRTLDVPLWQDDMPYDNGLEGDTPRLKVFLPAKAKATGRAVLLCPGGGYRRLCSDYEGTDWAPFFNSMGIAVAVLHYRMPNAHPKAPVSDAQQALRMLRANAHAWHIDTHDVGIVGFSAGGHLAATVAVHGKGDTRPDFQLLFYPVVTMQPAFTNKVTHDNLLGRQPSRSTERYYSAELNVSAQTPRACIVLAYDDETVDPINSIDYYRALNDHHVPASIMVYADGGHAFGMHPWFKHHTEMLLYVKAWLESF